MLEHVPTWLGHLLRDRRAGHDKLVSADPTLRLPADMMTLSSPAFSAGGRLPVRFTADGEGVSPPLVWADVPVGTRSLALIVEDPDAPAMKPLVHAIVWAIPIDDGRLAEGAIRSDGDGGISGDVGRNSYLQQGWLPPDPPSGHGVHDYVFQMFALGEAATLSETPGRSAFVEAIAGHVLATGILIGTYARESTSEVRAGDAIADPATGQAPSIS